MLIKNTYKKVLLKNNIRYVQFVLFCAIRQISYIQQLEREILTSETNKRRWRVRKLLSRSAWEPVPANLEMVNYTYTLTYYHFLILTLNILISPIWSPIPQEKIEFKLIPNCCLHCWSKLILCWGTYWPKLICGVFCGMDPIQTPNHVTLFLLFVVSLPPSL